MDEEGLEMIRIFHPTSTRPGWGSIRSIICRLFSKFYSTCTYSVSKIIFTLRLNNMRMLGKDVAVSVCLSFHYHPCNLENMRLYFYKVCLNLIYTSLVNVFIHKSNSRVFFLYKVRQIYGWLLNFCVKLRILADVQSFHIKFRY